MWITHLDCTTIIEEAWSTSQVGSHAFKLSRKLNTPRDKFRIWNKEAFGKVEKDIEKKKEELRIAQEQIYSIEDVTRESEVRNQLEQLLDREALVWSQKARVEWDLKGDRNKKYFQTVVKNRRRHNRIIQIKNNNEDWLTDPTDIEQCFGNHFHNLYSDP